MSMQCLAGRSHLDCKKGVLILSLVFVFFIGVKYRSFIFYSIKAWLIGLQFTNGFMLYFINRHSQVKKKSTCTFFLDKIMIEIVDNSGLTTVRMYGICFELKVFIYFYLYHEGEVFSKK